MVDYNLQEKKTSQHWLRSATTYTQRDLVNFMGLSNQPQLPLAQQGEQFKRYLAIGYFRYNPDHKTNSPTVAFKTIIQSFDLSANPNLEPAEAHQMGIELFQQFRQYLHQQYNYDLNTGLVSTHIDRDHPKNGYDGRQLQPHLHNHILLPTFNSHGQHLTPLLKQPELEQLKSFADGLVYRHGLNDYYFDKFNHLVNPTTPDRRCVRFFPIVAKQYQQASQVAWQQSPNDFLTARRFRTDYLRQQFQAIEVNPAPRVLMQNNQFRPLSNTNVQYVTDTAVKPTYVLTKGLRFLSWDNEQQAMCEHYSRFFDFTKTNTLSCNYQQFNRTVETATDQANQAASQNNAGTNKIKVSLYNVFNQLYASMHMLKIEARRRKDKVKQLVTDFSHKINDHFQARDSSDFNLAAKLSGVFKHYQDQPLNQQPWKKQPAVKPAQKASSYKAKSLQHDATQKTKHTTERGQTL